MATTRDPFQSALPAEDRLPAAAGKTDTDENVGGGWRALQALGATLKDVSSSLRGERGTALETFSSQLDKASERLKKRREEAEKIATGNAMLTTLTSSLGKYLDEDSAKEYSSIAQMASQTDAPMENFTKITGALESFKTEAKKERGNALDERIKQLSIEKSEATLEDRNKTQPVVDSETGEVLYERPEGSVFAPSKQEHKITADDIKEAEKGIPWSERLTWGKQKRERQVAQMRERLTAQRLGIKYDASGGSALDKTQKNQVEKTNNNIMARIKELKAKGVSDEIIISNLKDEKLDPKLFGY